MPTLKSHRLLTLAIAMFLILAASAVNILAQDHSTAPDLTVAGIKLGDRVSGKAFLGIYQPRTDSGQPTYYFYNKLGNAVMKLTAASFDDPYFVTGIEVFAVDDSYKKTHFYLDKISYFQTESGIFIGSHQSGRGIAATLIIGSPVPLGMSSVSPKAIVRKKGEPSARNKSGNLESMDYRQDTIDLGGENATKFGYAAHYEFEDRQLQRYAIKILPK